MLDLALARLGPLEGCERHAVARGEALRAPDTWQQERSQAITRQRLSHQREDSDVRERRRLAGGLLSSDSKMGWSEDGLAGCMRWAIRQGVHCLYYI